MATVHCDVAFVGAGTAGLAAERSARGEGASTLLIDEAFAGTTCTTVGCMPSKLLIAAGQAAHSARRARLFGVSADPTIDGRAVMSRLRAVRGEFVGSVKAQFEALPEGVMRKARARFSARTTLALDDGGTVEAKAIVIATGARPSIPEFLEKVSFAVLTNETLFELDDLPASVAVIGAGPLGLELAQALARLGVQIAVFDEGGNLAGLDQGAPADSLRSALEDEFEIHLGVKLAAEADGKQVRLAWTGKSRGQRTFAYVLAAAGRPPRLTGLSLEAAGLPLDEHGTPKVDPTTLQCGDGAIFFAGDAEQGTPVLHEAQAEGAIAGRNAARFPKVEHGLRTTPLAILFTEPGMARLGEVYPDLSTVCGTASFADQGRAKAFAVNRGRVEIVASAKEGRLLSATIVAPAAEHLAHLLAWAIEQGLSAEEVLAMPFYHPTFEEGLRPALREICETVGTKLPDGFVPGG